MQFGAQRCLVEDAGGFLVMEQLMPVDGAPHPVRAQQFVRDQGVGVQLRIPGARRPVVEQGGGEPAGADLLDAVGAAPRQRRVRVEVGEGGEDGGAVRLRDVGLRGRTTQCPQHADALGCRERQVEPGDRIRPPRPTQRLAGDGVQAAGEDRLELLLTDLAARLEAELGESATDPHAGLLTGTEVVLARADRDTGLVIPPGGAADLRRRQHAFYPRTDIATRAATIHSQNAYVC